MADTPAVDFSSLHKFFVSAGIAAIVGSVLIVWALLQASTVLMVDRADLAGLTEGGRSGVLRQQFMLNAILEWAWLIWVLVGIGLFLLILGVRQWIPRQSVQNESENLALERLRKSTAEERRTEADEEFADQVADVARQAVLSGDEPAEALASGAPDVASERIRSGPLREQSESKLRRLLERDYGAAFTVESDLVIDTGLGRVGIDLLLTPRARSGPSVVIDVKVPTRRPSQTLLQSWVFRTASAVEAVSSATNRSVEGIVVVISPNDIELPSLVLPVAAPRIRVVTVRLDDLDDALSGGGSVPGLVI